MKHFLIVMVALGMVVACGANFNSSAQESGQCYFVANQDIYLKIYNRDQDGVEREAVWSGFLPEGGTQAFHAPYGKVGYAVKKNPDDPWEETREVCMNNEAIQIP